MCSGERPVGAGKGKQTRTMALCQPPPPTTSRVWGGGDLMRYLAHPSKWFLSTSGTAPQCLSLGTTVVTRVDLPL